MIIPNTTITVFRNSGTTADDWGDEIDQDTPAAVGLPASIETKQKRTFNPGSGQHTIMDGFQISLRPRAFAFGERDRVKDERSGLVYQVETVSGDAPGLMPQPIKLFCTKVR